MKSRLAAKGKVVVIMTPWTDDDLAARIIRSEKNVQLIRLPVEAEENDPIGREAGEALCPELVMNYKLNSRQPLIVEIPDRHGNGRTGDNITKYVRDAIGIKLE